MVLWATWASWRFVCSWQGGWMRWLLKDPFLPKLFCTSMDATQSYIPFTCFENVLSEAVKLPTALPGKLILLMQHSCISVKVTHITISNKFFCMFRARFCQSFVLLSGIFKCFFLAFVVWTDLTLFLSISYKVARRNREKKKGSYSSHLSFLMGSHQWCLHRVFLALYAKSHWWHSSALCGAPFPSLFAHCVIIVFLKEHLLVPLHQKLLILL